MWNSIYPGSASLCTTRRDRKTLAPKRHQASDFDTLSTAAAPLETSKNAGNYDDFCVDIVEVTDSSSVPPTNENTEKTNETTER